MATVNKKAADVPKYKKGNVTIEGVNFNDQWARDLKPSAKYKTREEHKSGDGVEMTAEERFLEEYRHCYENLEEAARTELLKKAFKGCIEAE